MHLFRHLMASQDGNQVENQVANLIGSGSYFLIVNSLTAGLCYGMVFFNLVLFSE